MLIEHAAVAEAAVVPSPDPLRLAVPKAYVVLAAGCDAGRGDGAVDLRSTAGSTWRRTSGSGGWSSASCPRRSRGKIRRVELREAEVAAHAEADARPPGEFRDDDFPALRGSPASD